MRQVILHPGRVCGNGYVDEASCRFRQPIRSFVNSLVVSHCPIICALLEKAVDAGWSAPSAAAGGSIKLFLDNENWLALRFDVDAADVFTHQSGRH